MLKKTEPHDHRKFPLTEQAIERAEKDPWSVDMGTIQNMADHIRRLEGMVETFLWATEDWEVLEQSAPKGDTPAKCIHFSAPGLPAWEDICRTAENMLITRKEADAEKAPMHNGQDG